MVLRASAGVVWCCRGRAGAETGSEQRLLASALFPHAYGWTAASAPLRRSDERSESGATSTCIDAKGPNCKCAAPVELAVGKTLASKSPSLQDPSTGLERRYRGSRRRGEPSNLPLQRS